MRHIYAIAGLLAVCCTLLLPVPTQALPTPAGATSSTLVKNINTGARGANPQSSWGTYLTALGSKALYANYNRNNGYELWSTDGTSAGTALLRDLNPGYEDSRPFVLVRVGSKIFFQAAGPLGRLVWASDGTTNGTNLVLNPQTGRPLGANYEFFPSGNSVYFRSDGNTLWRSDGTASGTVLLNTWPSFSLLGSYVSMNSQVFFFVTFVDGFNSRVELWQTDGTAVGTQFVKIVSTNSASLPEDTAVVGNQLYFKLENKLWRSDGTALGTQQILTLSSFAGELESYAGELYYRGTFEVLPPGPQPLPEFHTGLLRLANNSTTPQVVHDFGNGNFLFPDDLLSVGNRLYFQGPNNELWASNGTVTAAVITAASQNVYDASIEPPLYTPFYLSKNGSLLFSAAQDSSASTGYGLWSINETTGVAQLVRQFAVGQARPGEFADIGTTILFSGEGGLWKTDGSEAGTVLYAGKPTEEQGIDGPFPGPQPFESISIAGRTLFTVVPDVTSRELWVSDGTAAGTTKIYGDSAHGSRFVLLSWNNIGYFIAPTPTGFGIWQTNGTVAGTTVLKSFDSPVAVYGLVATPQHLYIIAGTQGTSGASGDIKLWQSDGTEAGTVAIATLPSYASFGESGIPRGVEVVGERLFFTASTEANGRELWVTDGTQVGTQLVKDIASSISSPNLLGLTAVGNRLFFLEGFTISLGYNLWVSDGTEAGTTIAKALGPVPSGLSNPILGETIDYAGKAFFSGWDTSTWVEPWISDGTEVGTQRIKDVNQQPSFMGPQLTGASLPFNMVVVNGRVLFAANDGIHGRELWLSDGTEAGTALLIDLNPGAIGSAPGSITSFGSFAVFAASSGPDGVELWKTDGTVAGTTRLADVAAGPGSSNPSNMQLVGTKLFFLADDGVTGRELHALEVLLLSNKAYLPVVVVR